jgi:hypothetical protein
MLVVKSGATKINEPDLRVLKHPGSCFAVGNRLLGVRAVVKQNVFWLQVGVRNSKNNRTVKNFILKKSFYV